MAAATPTDGSPGLRADARRNRALILQAARDTVVDLGPGAPLEEIAARAGVGIATLYRRFPERSALLRAVVLDLLQRVAEAAEAALAEEDDPFQALARYMHGALDIRVSAVMPILIGEIAPEDMEVQQASRRSGAAVQALIDQAQAAGALRPDVAFADIALMLIRLARPLPGPFPRAVDDALAHRHLALVLDGLRTSAHQEEGLPGPAFSMADLQGIGAQQDSAPHDSG